MYFLLFFNESIVLSNSAKGELVHQINLVGLPQVFILYDVSCVC